MDDGSRDLTGTQRDLMGQFSVRRGGPARVRVVGGRREFLPEPESEPE